MRRSSLLPACALLLSLPALSLTGGTVRADLSVVPPLPPAGVRAFPAPPPTLAQALAALPPPKQDLFLTVGADKVTLPPGGLPPEPDSGPKQVGGIYGRMAWEFGGVTALGPPTMVVLNPSPGDPHPFDGMPPTDALKLLLAGLTPPQWAALTGPSGLGLSDLTGDVPRALFEALLPVGDVKAFPQAHEASPQYPIPLTAQDLRGMRLRLGRETAILFPKETDGSSMQFTGTGAPDLGKPRYYANALNFPNPLSAGPPPGEDKPVFGAVLRETLPNSPKEADLDYDAPALARSVRLDGVATAGDLLARVGKSAGLELYADRRYERRSVTLAGRRTARGRDLLRAAAFCVAGTFRRVGPAYVLTDDREGIAPRRERLRRFVEEAEMGRHEAVAAAGDSLLTAHGGLDALPSLDGLDESKAQKALAGDPFSRAGNRGLLTFAQLSPAQQESARRQVQQWNEEADRFEQTPGGHGQHGERLTLAGPFLLSSSPYVFLLSPAVPGTVDLPGLSADRLFQPSGKLQAENWHKMEEDAAKDAARNAPPPVWRHAPPSAAPAVKLALAPFPRRALLAAPRTVSELDSVIASMKALGLNQLWLDVFSGGHSVLDKPAGESPLAPNNGGTGGGAARSSLAPPLLGAGGSSPAPPSTAVGAGGRSSSPDILTEALARTKGTGIAVLPAVDLLRWGADAPAEACDRTVLGETSAQAAAWRQRYLNATQDTQPQFVQVLPTDQWACPAAPAAEATLLALVRRLAATPGVAALALRGTVPPGYGHPHGSSSGMEYDDLGYVPPLRLAFLRRAHVDPLDLDTSRVLPSGADLSVPGFDDDSIAGNTAEDWNTFRDEAGRGLFPRLLAAAQEAGGPQFRFLLPARGDGVAQGWYGLWDTPQAPLPELPPAQWHSPPGADFAKIAHARSRIVLAALPPWLLTAPSSSPVADLLPWLKPGWDGLVLDATVPAQGQSGADLLANLARGAAR